MIIFVRVVRTHPDIFENSVFVSVLAVRPTSQQVNSVYREPKTLVFKSGPQNGEV